MNGISGFLAALEVIVWCTLFIAGGVAAVDVGNRTNSPMHALLTLALSWGLLLLALKWRLGL